MGHALAVAEYYVGLQLQVLKCLEQRRNFSKRKKSRNVGK